MCTWERANIEEKVNIKGEKQQIGTANGEATALPLPTMWEYADCTIARRPMHALLTWAGGIKRSGANAIRARIRHKKRLHTTDSAKLYVRAARLRLLFFFSIASISTHYSRLGAWKMFGRNNNVVTSASVHANERGKRGRESGERDGAAATNARQISKSIQRSNHAKQFFCALEFFISVEHKMP